MISNMEVSISEDKKPKFLSGRYKDSFAYPTLKDRVPTIICKVIDLLHRQRRVLEQDQNTLKNCIEKMESFLSEYFTSHLYINIILIY